jgi:cytochrome c5
MSKLLSILCIHILLMGCTKKITPVISDRKVDAPTLNKNNYPPEAKVSPNLEKGKALFNSACKKCHDTPAPDNFIASAWDGFLYSMFPRTGLSNEDAFHVREYVMANAKKK